jgi:hypothetical protein
VIRRFSNSSSINPFDTIAEKGEVVSFSFVKNSDQVIEKTELQLSKGSSSYCLSPKVYRDKNGAYCMDHPFKSKGTHVVHLLLNSRYIFAYAVQVN